jgi:hypothetical protein
MKLYRLETGIGTYWVVAEHPTDAEKKLMHVLNENNYGFHKDRTVTRIDVIAEQINSNFITGKFLIL